MEDIQDWLHCIHAWDEAGAGPSEMAASVSEMEQILAREIVKRFAQADRLHNSLVFHDHTNGGAPVSVASEGIRIEPSREGLLRVIGCGHFLLSHYKHAIDQTLKVYAGRQDLAWATSYLSEVSSEWEHSSLDLAVPCDARVGIGQHFNDFARSWLTLNSSSLFTSDQVDHYMRVRGIQFLCRTMCFSDHSRDLPNEHRNAYKEFLYLHMCCIVEHEDLQPTDPQLLAQYRLMNRKPELPPLPELQTILPVLLLCSEVDSEVLSWTERQMQKMQKTSRSKLHRSVKHHTMSSVTSSAQYHKTVTSGAYIQTQSTVTTGSGQSKSVVHTTSSSVSSSLSQSSQSQAKTVSQSRSIREQVSLKTREIRDQVFEARIAGLVKLGSSSNTQWSRYDDFDESDWIQTEDGTHLKVVEAHWKLGCKGCPDGSQKQVSKHAKQKQCNRWVTVKKTVLVKRPANAEEK